MKNSLIHFRTNLPVAVFFIFLLSSCSSGNGLYITFEAFVNGESFEPGKRYPSPNGDGTYRIDDFKVYVSNIRLVDLDTHQEEFVEKDSYHLLRFQDGNDYSIQLKDLEYKDYDRIHISIGIDEAANLSTDNPGDLDPTNQMAWNWTVGYKFLLLEGLYIPEDKDREVPIVFHVGFSVNKKDLEFDLKSTRNIAFRIDIDELFKNPNPIDFNEMPKVLFNEELAAVIANNYAVSFLSLL